MPSRAAFERHRVDVRARLRARGVPRAGPGSTSWKVNREMVAVAGWGRAILLQLAHPLVAAGIDAHSGFRLSLPAGLARFRSTVRAMLSLTFGDDDEAVSTAAGINLIHDRVLGQLGTSTGAFPASTSYSAHDAHLLAWVHATLVDSIPLAYQQLVGPLTPDERNRYCTEATIMEPLLDIPAGMLPRTTTALDEYMRDAFDSGTMVVTDAARALAHAVLYPPRWWLLWPAFRPVQLLTIGLLPEPVRRAYGFRWTARDARAMARWTTAVRVGRRVVPAMLREWPSARRTHVIGTAAAKSHERLTPA